MRLFLRFSLIPFLFFGICAYGQDIPEIDRDELQKTKPWEAIQYYEPVPIFVTPNQGTLPPLDAIVLFDG